MSIAIILITNNVFAQTYSFSGYTDLGLKITTAQVCSPLKLAIAGATGAPAYLFVYYPLNAFVALFDIAINGSHIIAEKLGEKGIDKAPDLFTRSMVNSNMFNEDLRNMYMRASDVVCDQSTKEMLRREAAKATLSHTSNKIGSHSFELRSDTKEINSPEDIPSTTGESNAAARM